MEKKTFWLATTNSDLNEGRGHDVPIALCETRPTAVRLAKGRGVQGSNAHVEPIQTVNIDGAWFVPQRVAKFERATSEDLAAVAQQERREAAEAKAREAGLSEAEIRAIKGVE